MWSTEHYFFFAALHLKIESTKQHCMSETAYSWWKMHYLSENRFVLLIIQGSLHVFIWGPTPFLLGQRISKDAYHFLAKSPRGTSVQNCGGYHQNCRGIPSVHWRIFSTVERNYKRFGYNLIGYNSICGFPSHSAEYHPMYGWYRYPTTVLITSPSSTLHPAPTFPMVNVTKSC